MSHPVNLHKFGDDIFYAIFYNFIEFYLRKRHTTSSRANQWKSFSRLSPALKMIEHGWTDPKSAADQKRKVSERLLVFQFSSLNITLAL